MSRTCTQGWFISVPPRAKKFVINQSRSWTNAEVKSGKGKEKRFFPPTKLRCSKKWVSGFR